MERFNVRKSIKVRCLNRLKKTNLLNQHIRFRKKKFAKFNSHAIGYVNMECIVNNVKELLLKLFYNATGVLFLYKKEFLSFRDTY